MAKPTPFHPNPAEFDAQGNVTRLPTPGATLRQVFILEIGKAIVIHGDTNNRDHKLIGEQAEAIADELLRRAA